MLALRLGARMTTTRTVHPPEPSSDDIAASRRFEWDGNQCMALWYPQMGGYVGRAVAVNLMHSDGEPGCIDVYVWHDGEFPFTGDDEFGRGPVRRIHHCDAGQFILFGEELEEFQASLSTERAK